MIRVVKVLGLSAVLGAVLIHGGGWVLRWLAVHDEHLPDPTNVLACVLVLVIGCLCMPASLWPARCAKGVVTWSLGGLLVYGLGGQIAELALSIHWDTVTDQSLPGAIRYREILRIAIYLIILIAIYHVLLYGLVQLKSLRTLRQIRVPSLATRTGHLSRVADMDWDVWEDVPAAWAVGGGVGASLVDPWLDLSEHGVGSSGSLGDEWQVNPASGLPMVSGSSIDVMGNLIGTDANSIFEPWSDSFGGSTDWSNDDGCGIGIDDWSCHGDDWS